MGTVDGSVAVVDSVVATMVATAVVVPSGVVATRVGVHTHGDVLEQPAGPVCCLLVRVGCQTGGQTSQQHLRINTPQTYTTGQAIAIRERCKGNQVQLLNPPPEGPVDFPHDGEGSLIALPLTVGHVVPHGKQNSKSVKNHDETTSFIF